MQNRKIQNAKKSKTVRLYLNHVVLTIGNLERSLDFYTKILGKPHFQDGYSFMYKFGQTKLFFGLPYGKQPKNNAFNPNRIGLEHLALGVPDLKHLKIISKRMDRLNILHSKIHVDKDSKKEKIWLADPDGIRIEFFI